MLGRLSPGTTQLYTTPRTEQLFQALSYATQQKALEASSPQASFDAVGPVVRHVQTAASDDRAVGIAEVFPSDLTTAHWSRMGEAELAIFAF